MPKDAAEEYEENPGFEDSMDASSTSDHQAVSDLDSRDVEEEAMVTAEVAEEEKEEEEKTAYCIDDGKE